MGTVDEDLVPPLPKGLVAVKEQGVPSLPKGLTPVEKKNPVGNDVKSGTTSSANGSHPSQDSPQSTELTNQLNGALQAYQAHLSPQDHAEYQRAQQAIATKQPDQIRATTKKEQDAQHAMDTTLGKISKSVAYVGSETAKGGVDVLKGGAWVLNHLNTNLSDTQLIPDKAFNAIDGTTDFGVTKGQRSQIESGKDFGMGAARTLGMIGNFTPAALGGEAAGIPKTMFALQGFGQGTDEMNAVDPDHKLNPVVRDLYIAGKGAVNGIIMGDLGENFFSKPIEEKITAGIVSHAMQEVAEKGLTEDGLKEAVKSTTKDFTEKFYDTFNKVADKTSKAAIDLSALQAADYALKKGVDISADQPVFNASLGQLMEGISDVVTKQAPLFGGIGAMMGGAKADPVEVEKMGLGKQIQAIDEQLKTATEKSDDPVVQAENEVKQEGLEKQREELNNKLKQLIVKQNESNENAQKGQQKEANGEKGNEESQSSQKGNEEGNDVTKAGEAPAEPVYKEAKPENVTSPELKGKEYKSEMMSPQDYLKQSEEAAPGKPIDSKMVDEVKQAMQKGEPIEPATLTYDKEGNATAQDGRHRAQAAIELGIKEIPVVKIEGELPNATKEIKQQEGGGGEHPSGDKSGKAAETSGSHSPVSAAKGKGEKIPEGLTHQEADKWIIEHETNPHEIAARYHTEQNYANEKEKAIIDYLGNSKINEKDYNRWGDRKRLGDHTDPKRLRWIDSTNSDDVGLDVHAEALSHELGYEVTPEDFIDVIDKYKGREHFNEENKSETQKLLEQRYQELIGKKLTSKIAEKAFTNKLNLTPKEHNEVDELLKPEGITTKDIENEQQERNQSSEATSPVNADEKGIQQPQDDGIGNVGKNTAGEAAQAKEGASGTTAENKNAPPQESALNIASVSENREVIGKESIDKPEKIDLDEEYRKVVKKVDDGTLKPLEIAQRIIDKRETPTIEEFNAMLYHNRQIDNRYGEAQKQVEEAEKSGNVNDINEARNALIALDRSKDLLHTAARNVSYNWGFMGRLLQEAVKKDYSLSNLRRLFRAKSTDGKIPEDIDKLLTQYSKERDEALKALQDYQSKEAERSAQKEVDRQKRQQGRVLKGEKLDKAIEDTFKSISDKLKAQRTTLSMNPIPVEMLPDIAKLVGYYTQKGVLKATEVAEHIYERLKDDIDGLTKRDVIDAIAGNGYEKEQKTADELTREKAEIKRQAKLVARLEDLESGRVKPTIIRSRAKISAEVERLREQIKKTAIDMGLPLKNHKEYLRKKLAELEQKIKDGDYSKKPKPNRVEPDMEVQQLRAKIKRSETRINELGATLDERRESAVKKVLDGYSKVHRLFVLSRVGTLAKLASAAAGRAITTPIEEVLGSINKIIPGFRKIAERSPRYAKGFKVSDEVKAIATHFTKKQWQQNLQVLKEGHSDLDYMFDPKAYKEDGDVVGFPGRMHAMLKNSTKTAEFIRSFSHILQWEKDNNPKIDINDEAVQERIGKEAMKLAQRSIFMNDNMAVDLYKDIITIAEKKWGNTGTAVATVMRAMMPIVKIPTNFALEATDIATLGARSWWTIGKAVARGAETLSPKEADFVMRMLRKGEMGAVFMAVAYLHPDAFGGYYIQGEKRDKKDLKEGDLKLFGVKIPHLLQHWPLISAMQAAATLRRTQDYYLSKGKEGGTRAGVLNGLKGIYENVPFLELPGQITKALESDNATDQFVGQIAKSQLVPGLIQEVAEQTDTKDGSLVTINPDNVVKRKPDTKSGMIKAVKENIMSGIPGWREMVGEKPEEPDKQTPVIKLMNGDELKLNDKQIKEREKLNQDYIAKHQAGLTKRFTIAAKQSKSVKEKLKKLSSFWKAHNVPLEKQKEYKQLIIDNFVKTHIKKMANEHSKIPMLKKYKKADGSYDFSKVDE